MVSRELKNGLVSTLGIIFFMIISCKQNSFENNMSDHYSIFGRGADTFLTLPISKERIDTHTYRLDEATRVKTRAAVERNSDRSWVAKALTLKAVFQLDYAEAYAIDGYSANLYLSFKKMVEGTLQNLTSDTELFFKAAVSGVNKLPAYQGTVYFGAALSQDYLDELKTGSSFVNRNFLSTSKDLEVARRFAQPGMDARQDSVRVIFEVEDSCHGRDISSFSAVQSEKEVLFLPMHPFKVVSNIPTHGDEEYFRIKLRETIPCKNSIQNSQTRGFPRCGQKRRGVYANVYSSFDKDGVLASFKPKTPMEVWFLPPKGSRYEIYTTAILPTKNQECITADCTRIRVELSGDPPSSSNEVLGVRFKSFPQDPNGGVLTENSEILSSNVDEKTTLKHDLVVMHGYMDTTDLDLCK